MFQRNNNNIGVCLHSPRHINAIVPNNSGRYCANLVWVFSSVVRQSMTTIVYENSCSAAFNTSYKKKREDIRDENTDGSNPSLLNISDMTQRMKALNASKFVKRWWWGRIGKGNQRNSFQLAFKGNAPSAALYVCVHWALCTNMQWSTRKVGRTDEKKTQPSLHPLDLSN